MTTQQHDLAEKLRADHLNLVYASALRQMPGDPQSAADVTQAVFLVAFKKANNNRLPEDHRMAGWLLKITAYAVKESRRAARRRSAHETQAAAQPRPLPPEPDRSTQTREITAILDQSLLKLGSLDREVLIRRYLRDEPLPALAAAVNMNENTAGRRIARALEKLRKLLAHRGITAPAATLTAILLTQAALKPPAALAAAVPTSPAAASLAKLVLWRLTMAKTTAIAIAAGILFIGTGAIVGVILASGGNGTPPEKPAPLASTATGPATPMVQVTAVTEENSDKLLKEVLDGIETNRKKLKTLKIQGVSTTEDWNPDKKIWEEESRTEGSAWIEAAEPRRTRIEISYDKTHWIDGAAPFLEESFTEIWDGKKTRRLYGPPYSDPRGDIRDDRMLMGKAIIGGNFSLQLIHENGEKDGKEVIDDNPLDPAVTAHFTLSARRVILNGNLPAVELNVALPSPARSKVATRYWFDPNRGYALLGKWETDDGITPFMEIFIDELTEAAAGVFYPVRARFMDSIPRDPPRRGTFSATNVVANKPHDAATYEFRLPKNVPVTEPRGGGVELTTQR